MNNILKQNPMKDIFKDYVNDSIVYATRIDSENKILDLWELKHFLLKFPMHMWENFDAIRYDCKGECYNHIMNMISWYRNHEKYTVIYNGYNIEDLMTKEWHTIKPQELLYPHYNGDNSEYNRYDYMRKQLPKGLLDLMKSVTSGPERLYYKIMTKERKLIIYYEDFYDKLVADKNFLLIFSFMKNGYKDFTDMESEKFGMLECENRKEVYDKIISLYEAYEDFDLIINNKLFDGEKKFTIAYPLKIDDEQSEVRTEVFEIDDYLYDALMEIYRKEE